MLIGLRFSRRGHILARVSVNVSKSGPSLSVGVRGAHVTFGRRGVTRRVGIPGTGIYSTSRSVPFRTLAPSRKVALIPCWLGLPVRGGGVEWIVVQK